MIVFRLNVAPEVFQEINTQNFGDIEGAHIFVDNLLTSALTKHLHNKVLNLVVARVRQINVKFYSNKFQDSEQY